MNIVNIILRELRVLSRRLSLYWTRMLFLGLIFLSWFLPFIFFPHDGTSILLTVTVISTIFFGIGASITVSDSISSERRGNTLGLLMLTPLRPLSVLSGKMITGFTQFWLCLFAIMPFVALPVLSGGVTWSDVLRCCLNIWAMTFLGLSIGLFWTVVFREIKNTATASFLTMLGIYLYPFVLMLIMEMLSIGILNSIYIQGPLITLMSCSVGNDYDAREYNEAIAAIFGTGSIMMLGAYIAFRLIWKWEKIPRTLSVTKRSARQTDESPTVASKKNRWRKFTELNNPYRSLIGAFGQKHRVIDFFSRLVFFSILICIGTVVIMDDIDAYAIGMTFAVLMLIILELLVRWTVAVEAPRQMLHDRKTGMTELLLVTPLSDILLFTGLLFGIRRSQTKRSCLLATGHLLTTIGILAISEWKLIQEGEILLPVVYLAGTLFLSFYELYAIQKFGIWLATRIPQHLKITGILFALNCLLPGILFILIQIFYILFIVMFGNYYEEYLLMALSFVSWYLWFLIRFLIAWRLNRLATGKLRELRRIFN